MTSENPPASRHQRSFDSLSNCILKPQFLINKPMYTAVLRMLTISDMSLKVKVGPSVGSETSLRFPTRSMELVHQQKWTPIQALHHVERASPDSHAHGRSLKVTADSRATSSTVPFTRTAQPDSSSESALYGTRVIPMEDRQPSSFSICPISKRVVNDSSDQDTLQRPMEAGTEKLQTSSSLRCIP